jgi:hypothetical protein
MNDGLLERLVAQAIARLEAEDATEKRPALRKEVRHGQT